MARIVLFGECMIELRPCGDGLWRHSFAGDTYNTAVYLSRLDRGQNHDIQFACGIGDDSFAQSMAAAWRSERVGNTYARCIPGRSTGLYAIKVDAAGERSFSYWRDTSAARAYFEVAETPLEKPNKPIDIFYLSGISLGILPPSGLARLLALIEAMRARGTKIVFDNNYRPGLWNSGAQAAQAMDTFIARSDIALVTLEDYCVMQPDRSEQEIVESCLAMPAQELVLKRGDRSTLVRREDGELGSVEVKAARPIDTTGAGDSFAAGYLSARIRGAPPMAAAAVGNALALRVVTHPGALMPRSALDEDHVFWNLLKSHAPTS